ncbi:MAG TPA: ATP-binding protein [Steroidobacteraceae bacterium]|nr:ATP-binding protein [Steroidobacteraceae bacterium]
MKPASSADSRRLQRWVTGAGVLLIVLMVGADSYEAWTDYGTAIARSEDTQLALVRATAEQTARMVQELDVVLADQAMHWGMADGSPAAHEAARERMAADVTRFPFVHSMEIFDREGHVAASTAPGLDSDVDYRQRPFFVTIEHAAPGALYIGKPTGHDYRTFAIGRAIRDRNGDFAGIVLARIAFEYLTGFYSTISVFGDSSIRLVRDDGVVLARYPMHATPGTGDDISGALIAGMQAPEVVRRDARSSPNPQLRVLRRVQAYPLVVELAQPMSSVLSAWKEDQISSYARTLTLAGLAGVLLVVLRRVLRRRDRLEEERRRLEQGLRDSQKAEAVGFLAASMAHDFNNVLSAIVGYAEVARTQVGDDVRVTAAIDGLLSASERARLLVRRVLTFDPHRRVVRNALAIEPIVSEALALLRPGLPSSITVRPPAPGTTGMINGDATEVHQVVMNLCTNAVRAMRGGGQLEVLVEAVRVDAPRQLTLGTIQPGRWLRLSVIDTGTGLAPDQLQSIFSPFYTSRAAGEGSGIGLTVVSTIVTNMNGAIEVASRPGEGTRMSVYWPLIEPQPTDPATYAAPQAGGEGQAILIVDDEPELVRLAEEIVASLGYEAIGFSDATAAIESFRRAPARFDAVLTDERMPVLQGTTLAGMIHDLRADIPILLVTGHRERQTDARALRAGVVEILDKPLRAGDLREALGRAFATVGQASA